MDRCASSGAAEVPDVSPRLDVRTPKTVNPIEADEDTTPPSGDAAVSRANSANQKRCLFDPENVSSLLQTSGPKRQKGTSEPHSFLSEAKNGEQNETTLLQSVPQKMRKYFAQRHRLFHRYDEGIQLDEEAWYSVTPEKIAAHIASRFSHLKVVVDLYSCVGGNSIQFAKAGMRVIAVEIDHEKIRMAQNNAKVYGVEDNIEFKQGDALVVLSTLKEKFENDWGVFLSPPWGGPAYVHQEVFDVSVFRGVVDKAREVSTNVAILVPRNASIENIANTLGCCEVEKNYLGGKVKTKTLYFGDLEGRGATIDAAQGET